MNCFEKAFNIMFIATISITFIAFMLGALLLPKDNPSHEMNPFSKFKFYLEDNPDKMENIIFYGIYFVTGLSILTPIIINLIRKDEVIENG